MYHSWDHGENLKKCALKEGVHLKKEISYNLYILGTDKSVHLERKYIVRASSPVVSSSAVGVVDDMVSPPPWG